MKMFVSALAVGLFASSVSAATPGEFYQEKIIRTEAKSVRAMKARELAKDSRDQLVDQAEEACHSNGGEFVLEMKWTSSRKFSSSRFTAKATAVVSCIEI